MIVTLLAHAMPIPVTNTGWSWAASMGAIQNLLIAVLGGGGLVGVLKHLSERRKMENERSAQDDTKDATLRKELSDLTDRLTARIGKLEGDVSDERRRCDEELAAVRKAHGEEMAAQRLTHADEMRDLRKQLDGLQRMIIQWQISTGQMIQVPASDHPKANEAMERLVDKLKGEAE